MSVDWIELTRQAELALDGERVRVTFGSRRTQHVRVQDDRRGSGLVLTSIIAKRRVVDRLYPDILDRIAEQNRLSELVGYRIDGKGRLVGASWCPTAGLTVDEWKFYVLNLAEACDRLEFVLTGADRE